MFKRTLVGIFKSFEHTGENVKDPALKTKYYKLPREKVWAEVIAMLRQLNGYKLVHEMKNVGEIVAERKTPMGRKQDITFTLFAINPVRTAIDVYSASRGGMGDFGGNYRTILNLYKELDRRLNEHRLT